MPARVGLFVVAGVVATDIDGEVVRILVEVAEESEVCLLYTS